MPRASNRRTIPLPRLLSLWRQYCDFRQGQIAPSTYKRDYGKITRRIERLQTEAPHLRDAIKIRDWLLAHYSTETTRRTIQQFNACLLWASDSDMVTTNPFSGLSRQLRSTRPSDKAWAAFTLGERDRIIAAFDDQQPFYAPWVRFLFWTGCRPEEAAALRWEHISPTCGEVLFAEALPIGMEAPQATKNYRSTRFPCGDRLSRLLRSQRPSHVNRLDPVFPGRYGGRLNYQNFQRRQWRPLVMELAEKGAIAFYLSQYHTRHTWITGALANGMSVQDVSYLARVSTAVIYQHYAGRARQILVPEF